MAKADPAVNPKLKARVCPLCGGDDPRVLFTDRNRREGLDVRGSYVECSRCRMVYLTPIPDFASMGTDGFDQVYRVGGRRPRALLMARLVYGAARRVAAIFDRSARLHDLPKENGEQADGSKRRILDVGCTDGAKLRPFARRGWEVHGVDLTPSAIAAAKRSLPDGHFYLGPVDQVGLDAGSFDAIRADAVLEHVEDPVGFLRILAGLLKPEGLLFLYVPNQGSLCARLLRHGNINAWIPFHINCFTTASMAMTLAKAGLEPVSIRHSTPVSWLLLSVRQTLTVLRGGSAFSTQLSPVHDIARVPLGPVAAMLNLARLGEELVVTARRPRDRET